MAPRTLWLGPVAALIFVIGTLAIGTFTPGYSDIRQTVSELGEMGSPGQVAFTTLLCVVATCLIFCAFAVRQTLRSLSSSLLPFYFVLAMAFSCAGVGLFPFPHPLHNVFGLSETIGLQAPLFAALARSNAKLKGERLFSLVMYVIVLAAIGINLIPLFRPPMIWDTIKPLFGLVQRSLFAAWFMWISGYCILLLRAQQSFMIKQQVTRAF